MTVSWNSNAISLLSSWVKYFNVSWIFSRYLVFISHSEVIGSNESFDNNEALFCKTLLSISLFTAVFNHENEKSRPFLSSNTFGNIHLNFQVYSEANLDIIGQPGNPTHIIFATLSKASQALSS
jgi:hypothetical protein